MSVALFFCAPALGVRELAVIVVAAGLLVGLPLWRYWRSRRMSSAGRSEAGNSDLGGGQRRQPR